MIVILEDFFSKDLVSYFLNFYIKNKNKSYYYTDNNTYPLPVRDAGFFVSGYTDYIISSQINRISDIVNRYEFCRLSNAEIVMWPKDTFMDFHRDPKNDKFACIVYLNNDFSGGLTLFENIDIKPKIGTAIFFKNSQLLHAVSPVTSGTRYTFSCWFI